MSSTHRMREIVRSPPLLLSSDTTSNFLFNLSRPYGSIQQVSLISAVLPITMYTVTSLNNVLRYSSASSIEIQPGDYTISQLLSTIQSQLVLDTVVFPGGITVTMGTYSNLISFASPNSFSMPFGNISRSIGGLLGYLPVDLPTSISHTSQGVFDLARPRALIIAIDQLQGGDAPPGFLRMLPITGDSGELVIYTRTLDIPDRVFTTPLSLSQIRVRVTGEDGSVVDLNGAGILLLLELVIAD